MPEREDRPTEALKAIQSRDWLALLALAQRWDCLPARIDPTTATEHDWESVLDAVMSAALLSPPAAAQGWQPIETAPKDGTQIVAIGRPSNSRLTRATITAWYDRAEDSPVWAKGWTYCVPGLADTFHPTHWMPLPTAPQEARNGQ